MIASLLIHFGTAFMGIAFGWWVRSRTQIDYKKRWQNALALMQELRENGEIEKKVVIEKKIVHELPEEARRDAEADSELRRKLRRLPFYTRQEMEFDRLKAGLHPVDNLSGLPDFAMQEMVKRRLKYGYDESGRKFREERAT